MTEIRRKRTAKPEKPVEQAALLTADTATIEVVADPSLLYPPVKATDAIRSVGAMPTVVPETKTTKWDYVKYYAPLGIGVALLGVTIWAMTAL